MAARHAVSCLWAAGLARHGGGAGASAVDPGRHIAVRLAEMRRCLTLRLARPGAGARSSEAEGLASGALSNRASGTLPGDGRAGPPPTAPDPASIPQGDTRRRRHHPGRRRRRRRAATPTCSTLWLFGKSPHTRPRLPAGRRGPSWPRSAPQASAAATLGDLQAWAAVLPGKASSRAVALAAVKSLLTFGHRVGYLPVNVGAALPLPKAKDDLAARILDREAIFRLLDRAPTPATGRCCGCCTLGGCG